MSTQTIPDPRHMVTPDAFSVSEEVMGLPLATGRRRLAAFALDGILVGLLAMLGWKILGLFLAFFFFRVATKGMAKPAPQLGVASRAAAGIGRGFRYSVGCLGGIILFATFMIGTGFIERMLTRGDDGGDVTNTSSLLGNIATGTMGAIGLSGAETAEEAEEAAVAFGLALLSVNDAPDMGELRATIEESMPESLDVDRTEFLDRVEARIRAEARLPEPAADESAATADTMSLATALDVYAQGPPAEVDDPADSIAVAEATQRAELFAAAQRRITASVAADSLASLTEAVEDLEADLQRQAAATAEARREIEERGGVFAWFVDTLDELGLTFGWGALYFATLLTWFEGRTPGKRVMGLRVIRLDGEPITLYIAFERAGGYAAGVATGLLGFAQVLWDPNRQAIHDKIAGTVVIMDGQEKISTTGAVVS